MKSRLKTGGTLEHNVQNLGGVTSGFVVFSVFV